ncbi:MAG: pantoate--beta-alanine ligase [Bacteroidia bacterium]|nr:pantoate--beta-alanine ligase [Bacteroidia bacterium]
MQVFRSLDEFKKARKDLVSVSSIGLVPTMGALHAGHASLAERAVADNPYTIATIFVNPTQFGPNEDLDKYPRTLEADLKLLEDIGISAVLAPNIADVYGDGRNLISFQIEEMDRKLCGAKRPGHFNGVVQIVSILFNLVQPDKAYFGEKDFQQLMIIRRMIQELHFPLEAVGCPIIRESDGLAMSSRNRYLNLQEREQALFLNKTLKEIRKDFSQFGSKTEVLDRVKERMKDYPLVQLDYFDVLEARDLSEIEDFQQAKQGHLFVAAFLGKTRLIDNMSLS